jgi:hypothetical protein
MKIHSVMKVIDQTIGWLCYAVTMKNARILY